MFSLSLENRNGDTVSLTGSRDYSIMEIDGLYPPSANIVTSEVALYDGARFNSSKVNTRQLEISLAIERNAEENRIALYKVVKTKQYIRMNYENGARDVYIEGYVSDMNIDYFAMKQTATISILCPEPYFRQAQEIIDSIQSVVSNFHWPCNITAEDPIPFSYYEDITELNVINEGDVAAGMTIEIRALGEVTNPAILNRDTGEFFRLYTTLEAGDVVYIDTKRGEKSVRLWSDGEYTNIFNSIAQGSTWLQLEPGDNVFRYEADGISAQYMEVRFVHQHLYEGV